MPAIEILKSCRLSENTIQKIKNEVEIWGADSTITSILKFREIKRKEPRKTIRNALQRVLFDSSDTKYQKEIFDLFTAFAATKKSAIKTQAITPVVFDTFSKNLEWYGKNVGLEMLDNGDMNFVASDICACLNLSQVAQACSKLDSDEVYIAKSGPFAGKRMVTEPGMYKLIMRSNTKASKLFSRWIAHEVLPSIRKLGGYIRPDITRDQLEQFKSELLQKEELIKFQGNRINYLENNPRNDCDRFLYEAINSVNKKRAKGKDWNIDKEFKLVITAIKESTGNKVTIKQVATDPSLASEAILIIKESA
jgi:prophage antirepressor-like protein